MTHLSWIRNVWLIEKHCPCCVCVCPQPWAGVIWCSSMWASVPLHHILTLSAHSAKAEWQVAKLHLPFLPAQGGLWHIGPLVRCPCASVACILCQSHAEAGSEDPLALPARLRPQKFLLICSKTGAKAKVLSSAAPSFSFRDVTGWGCQSVCCLCPWLPQLVNLVRFVYRDKFCLQRKKSLRC